MSLQNLGVIGAGIVGTVLIVTCLMKVVAPFSFYRHVARLDLKLRIPLRVLVPVAIGFEGAWGTAVLVRMAPQIILPLTAAGLIFLTGLTWWSIKSGKTEDCGCYGGLITPSIGQTVALNGFYILLVVIAWTWLPPETTTPIWKIAIVALAAIITGATASYALESEFRTGVPLFTPSPLKEGQLWKKRWGGTAELTTSASQLVIYLGTDCPYCQRWVRVLNIIHQSPELPPVTGILASSPEKIETFAKDTGVRFPIATIPQARMQRLASLVPTTVLVENDVIREVWGGAQLSKSFAERFKAAFFPSVVQAQVGWQLPDNSVEHVPSVLPPILQQ